jgi:nitrite reductase/ring-hydroxylating ferredoxin subunit
MKNIFLLLAVITLSMGCSSDTIRNKNPYIPNYSFSVTIDANLPTYSGLKSAINPIKIPDNGQHPTLIVMKVGDRDYRAWDANCPNQYPSDCSQMSIVGVNAKCACDAIEYNLFNGVSIDQSAEYTMKPYRVESVGTDIIRISN